MVTSSKAGRPTPLDTSAFRGRKRGPEWQLIGACKFCHVACTEPCSTAHLDLAPRRRRWSADQGP